MSARRLTAADKRKIVELYRQPAENALTIAERYGVSNTTIGRILKGEMSVEEYDSLVQQKRSRSPVEVVPVEVIPVQGNLLEAVELPTVEAESSTGRRARRRSTVVSEPEPALEDVVESPAPVEKLSSDRPKPIKRNQVDSVVDADMVGSVVDELASVSREADLDDEDEDDLDDLDDDLDGDFDDDEGDDDEDDLSPLPKLHVQSVVSIIPLAAAEMPRVCYLVVDRTADLVVRPLQEFGELGQMPSEEIAEMTLPVFDNHRVAKRFSNTRTQRVIKVPDSRVFQKAALHLRAKGITRLLLDGQVYAI
ncbi:hypothetical protein [Alkalinema sp. FACHB-956]|uniref:hypothetical protein n=1 Tax=Alkalinema sp. FACHB-956 TaxID=2692768 RepID=UPI00168593FF|nr:hypothetical protein [Alkalinema sp. FACHB-956]MBD2326076.1 hypothetical protein [Alkalinema sp. FACHB-956]